MRYSQKSASDMSHALYQANIDYEANQLTQNWEPILLFTAVLVTILLLEIFCPCGIRLK